MRYIAAVLIALAPAFASADTSRLASNIRCATYVDAAENGVSLTADQSIFISGLLTGAAIAKGAYTLPQFNKFKLNVLQACRQQPGEKLRVVLTDLPVN